MIPCGVACQCNWDPGNTLSPQTPLVLHSHCKPVSALRKNKQKKHPVSPKIKPKSMFEYHFQILVYLTRRRGKR